MDCCNTIKESGGAFHGPRCEIFCNVCSRRKGVACNCDLSFAERVKQVRLDRAALKRFHEGR